jgi:hypothetical protein
MVGEIQRSADPYIGIFFDGATQSPKSVGRNDRIAIQYPTKPAIGILEGKPQPGVTAARKSKICACLNQDQSHIRAYFATVES